MKARPERPTFPHHAVHDKGDAGHVATVLKKSECKEQNKNIRQEGQDPSHTGDDTVYHQRGYNLPGVDGRQQPTDELREPVKPKLKITFEPIADGEGQKKHQRHDHKKMGSPRFGGSGWRPPGQSGRFFRPGLPEPR